MSKSGDKSQVEWKTIAGLGFIIAMVMWIWPMIQQKSIERPADNFAFSTLDDKSGQLTDYLGEPVILHFWATWCQVCAFELPEIKTLEKSYPVLNIAAQSGSDAEVLKHASENNMLINNIVNDKFNNINQQYGVIGYPTTFVVDKDGNIRFQKVGKITAAEVSAKIAEFSN